MSQRHVIANVTVIQRDRLVPRASVAVRGSRIESVDIGKPPPFAGDAIVVDGRGGFLAPGFIDLHIHGTHRFLIDLGPDHLEGLAAVLPRYGVTGFLPTVCPKPAGEDARALARLARVRSRGSQILGFHLEGPFLTLTGALPPEALGTADPARLNALMRAAGPHRVAFSVAPDFKGIGMLIKLMRQHGAVVFMTHTRADVKQTLTAIRSGAHHATHFFDVFPPPPESEPGVRPCGTVEAVLASPEVSVDFILDGEHVDPIAVRMALACKGPGGVCLITDANVGAGLPPGRHEFVGGTAVEFKYAGGPARLVNGPHAGALAGSGLTMDCAVRNAVRLLGVDIAQAVRMASANPAHVLGLQEVKGDIRSGFDADLVLLDRALNVQRTWVAGEMKYSRRGRA